LVNPTNGKRLDNNQIFDDTYIGYFNEFYIGNAIPAHTKGTGDLVYSRQRYDVGGHSSLCYGHSYAQINYGNTYNGWYGSMTCKKVFRIKKAWTSSKYIVPTGNAYEIVNY